MFKPMYDAHAYHERKAQDATNDKDRTFHKQKASEEAARRAGATAWVCPREDLPVTQSPLLARGDHDNRLKGGDIALPSVDAVSSGSTTMRVDHLDSSNSTKNQGLCSLYLEQSQDLDSTQEFAAKESRFLDRKVGSVPACSEGAMRSGHASTEQAEMTTVREPVSPSTTTGISPDAPSRSTEYSSTSTSQPTDPEIPFREGTIIEENQSTYLVAWSGAQGPTEVPKETVPEGIKKKWEELKAGMLPAKDIGYGRSRDIEAAHHAPVDFEVEASAKTAPLVQQPRKRRKVTPVNRQAFCSSRTIAAKPDDSAAIANGSIKTSDTPPSNEDLQALEQDFRSNVSYEIPSPDGEAHGILGLASSDDEDSEWEGKIVREIIVNGKSHFDVAWVNTIEPPENIGRKMMEVWEAKKRARFEAGKGRAKAEARSRGERPDSAGIKRGRGRPRKTLCT